MNIEQKLRQGAGDLGLRLDAGATNRFATLLALLERSSKQFNLTAVRDPEAILHRHFLESLALGAILRQRGLLAPGMQVLDLGSGAGFPGLPLKLLEPAIELALLEGTAKKAAFLRQAVEELSLPTTQVLTGRAETLAHDPSLRESFDLVTARAVAELPALVELSLPFLKLNGLLAAIKGSRAADEVTAAQGALRICGGEFVEIAALPQVETLSAVFMRKIGSTPDRYPRHPGQPEAHPLRARR